METSKLKLLALIGVIQLGSFGAGLYSGHTFWPKQSVQVIQPNYNTTETHTPTPANPQPTTNDSNAAGQVCQNIKGNISGKSRIYHMPGGAFYERTNPEMCFDTEAEAQAAGFVKSSR